jgi:Domain of Unknown Function with PDB structure (DUF3857)/Transglutaminase-like superfamily
MSLRNTLARWLLAVLLAGVAAASAAGTPDWLLDLARQAPAPATTGEAPAIVLLDETVLKIDETGGTVCTQRVAIAIQTKSGAEQAVGSVRYLEKSDALRKANAWLVRDGKTVRSTAAYDWLDYNTVAGSELVSEGRERRISYSEFAAPGDVFGYETRVGGPLLFGSFSESFGWNRSGCSLPVVLERLQLELPAGFTLDRMLQGGPTPAESVSADGRIWTWELRDRPYRRAEDSSDPAVPEDPTLLLRIRPPANATRFHPPVFRTWTDVNRWELALHQGQCDKTPAMTAKAEELTTGIANPFERIRALCDFTHQVRYIAVERGLARGFGYRPRKASEVLATGYGDCKDKSNLLCALLREIGMRAFLVTVLATEDPPVNPAWPSPDQFNHAIVAIEAPAGLDLPVIAMNKQGLRLLYFDPTDEDTPVGGLPWALQGSLGQLIADGVDELVELPRLPDATQWKVENRTRLTLEPDGSVSGQGRVIQSGQSATEMRRLLGLLSEAKLNQAVIGRLSDTMRGVSLRRVIRQDRFHEGQYGLEFELAAPSFAQPLRDTLALVRLDILSRDSVPLFTEKTRRTPVRLKPVDLTDEVELELPKGSSVDELPPPSALTSRFGTHERSFEVRDNTVIFRRRLVLKNCSVAVADYPALRQFLADAAKADRAAVVLRR